MEDKCTRGQDNAENLNRFNTAAGIANQFSTEQGLGIQCLNI